MRTCYLLTVVNVVKLLCGPICFSEQPLYFCKKLDGQEAEGGETAVFCCELSKASSAVQWKKGAVPLKSGSKYEIQQNGGELQLQIHELTGQDSGVYTCCVGALVTSASLEVKGAVHLFFNILK